MTYAGEHSDNIEPSWTMTFIPTISPFLFCQAKLVTDSTANIKFFLQRLDLKKEGKWAARLRNPPRKWLKVLETGLLFVLSVWRTAWLKGCVRKVHPLVVDWSNIHACGACELMWLGKWATWRAHWSAQIRSTKQIMEIHLCLIYALSGRYLLNVTLCIQSLLSARSSLPTSLFLTAAWKMQF